MIIGAAECALGLWLVSGWARRQSVSAGAVIACIYSGVLVGLAVTRGFAAPCPCGGPIAVSVGIGLARNMVLASLLGMVLLRYPDAEGC